MKLVRVEGGNIWMLAPGLPRHCCECGDRIIWDSVHEIRWQRRDEPIRFFCDDCWEPEP